MELIPRQHVHCATHNETFSHLFFHCNFAFTVMFYVLRYCGWRVIHRDWSSIVYFLKCPHHSKLRSLTLSLGLSALVYNIWKERNSRLLGDQIKSASCIHIIKCKLHSSNFFRKNAVRHNYGYMMLDVLV